MELETIAKLAEPNDSKIVLLVLDGLGGLGRDGRGPTELEVADTPNLDRLAADGICGLHTPVASGITPGSGPGHLGLFGYDPLRYTVGRGVLSALGVDFNLKEGDVAARGNFCTVDDDGRVTDRRAGRIATETNRELVERLRGIELDGAELFVETVKEHRFLVVLRGDGLSDAIADTDPQETGRRPLEPRKTGDEAGAERTRSIVADFIDQARQALADCRPANMVLLRGFAQKPAWPTLGELYQMRCACVANYPMYRGVARLAGMEALRSTDGLSDKVACLRESWDDYDFFFVHEKQTDSSGEDGDFDRRVRLIEEIDAQIPELIDLEPDVLVVTGDHSTPSALQAHSWHPVPVLLHSRVCRPDRVERFGERDCLSGGLGPRLPAHELMVLMAANARRLEKFGA